MREYCVCTNSMDAPFLSIQLKEGRLRSRPFLPHQTSVRLESRHSGWVLHMPRIIAACIGIFGLANAIAGCFRAELDANSWWIDFRGMPDGAARALIAVACCVLLAYALFPEMSAVRKALSLAILSVLLIASIANCVTYFALLFRGWIRTTMPIPLSAFVAAVFAWIAFEIYSERVAAREMKWHTIIPTLILCGVG